MFNIYQLITAYSHWIKLPFLPLDKAAIFAPLDVRSVTLLPWPSIHWAITHEYGERE